VVWESLVTEAGATVLLHAFVQEVEVSDGRLTALVVATKAGLMRIEAGVVIDASGDADVCHHGGFGYEAAESGDYDLPRREGSDHITPVSGMIATVMTRVEHATGDPPRSAADPDVLTRAEMQGRRQALEYVRFLIDRVPGYANASLAALSTQIGVRETRRVYGDYRLTRDDVLAARQFDDQIGLCGAPIEDHHGREGTGTTWEYLPNGTAVGIPLRTLIVRDAVNLFAVGRCFSATHDAQASVRSMAQCMAMGHAVGVASALAARAGGVVRDVRFADVRDHLRTDGAVLEVPAA
jgi:hypothetical protein